MLSEVLLISQLCGVEGPDSGEGATMASEWYHSTLAKDPVKPWEMRAMLRLGVERGRVESAGVLACVVDGLDVELS